MSDSPPPSGARIDNGASVSTPPGSPGVQHDGRGPNAEDSSPRRPKVATYQIFEATESNLKETRQRILQETAGHYIGPMPVTDFLDEFMSWNKEVPEKWKEVKVSQEQLDAIVTLPQCGEAQSYPQFIKALQGWSGLRGWNGMASSSAPPLRFEDSHKHRDRDCLSLSADISVYSGPQFVPRGKRQKMDFANLHSWVEIKPKQEYDAFNDGPATNEEEPPKPPQVPQVASDEEGDVQLIEEGEVERDPSLDVAADSEDPQFSREFEDDSPEEPITTLKGLTSFPFENGSASGCDTRAQLASYAGAVMATQYRNHLFTLLIVGKRARFMRWERASAIVTRSFDFTEEPLLLFEFFKRFRQLTLTQRGSNPHIKPATKKEAKLARTLLQNKAPELWLGLAGWVYLKDNSIDIGTQSFLKFEFDGQPIVIPAPHCHERGLSPFGRASRGVVAIALDKEDQGKGVACFVKDGWRDLHRLSEHEIYEKLHAAGVRNIADILCGGDWAAVQLDDEGNETPNGRDLSATVGHIYSSMPWVRCAKDHKVKSRRLQKNIIALKVIGLPLRAFRKAHELVGGLADAMEAYEDALQKAKIMHRDISAHNILLVRTESGEVRGILIDWDHSIIWNPSMGEVGSWRTGTWQFMSIALLRNAKARHTSADDRESSFHVLLWISLRHLNHILSQKDLRLLLEAFDKYEYSPEDHQFIGGDSKEVRLLRHMKKEKLGLKFQNVRLAPLTRLVRELAIAFGRRYGDDEPDEDDPQIKATVGNGEWLLSKLREAHRELKEIADTEEDWVNKVPDKTDQHLPAYLSHLVRSHFHWAINTSGTLKRSLAISSGGDDQEEEEAGGLEQDSERKVKRIKAKTSG